MSSPADSYYSSGSIRISIPSNNVDLQPIEILQEERETRSSSLERPRERKNSEVGVASSRHGLLNVPFTPSIHNFSNSNIPLPSPLLSPSAFNAHTASLRDVHGVQQQMPLSTFGNTLLRHQYRDAQGNRILAGNSLFLFRPENSFRKWLASWIYSDYATGFMLLCIVLHFLLLAIQGWPTKDRAASLDDGFVQISLIVIFVAYSIEILFRSIVDGFLLGGKQAYMRHTLHRIEFFSVVFFWADVLVSAQGVPFFFFKALSTLRLIRLLTLTNGLRTVLYALKESAPLLWNVFKFLLFFFSVFSILGVQAFRGSLSRRCVLTANVTNTVDIVVNNLKTCGSYFTSTGERLGADGAFPKGYTCPSPQICTSVGNSYYNFLGYDNILLSMLTVINVVTTEGWTFYAYQTMDAEYLAAVAYYILIIFFISFVMLDLFVAVIAESFAKIRSEKQEASGVGRRQNQPLEHGSGASSVENRTPIDSPQLGSSEANLNLNRLNVRASLQNASQSVTWRSRIRQAMRTSIYGIIYHCLIVIGIIAEATRYFGMSQIHIDILFTIQVVLACFFALDIFLRALSYVSLKRFLQSTINKIDLFLSVANVIIVLPPITSSTYAPYFSAFYFMRFYRLTFYLPRISLLTRSTLKSTNAIANLFLFTVIFTLIYALFCIQLFAGNFDFQKWDGSGLPFLNFDNLGNAVLALFQIISGDNWDDLMYDAMNSQGDVLSVALAAVTMIIFYFFTHQILISMLVAVLLEAFDLEDEEKRLIQVQNYLNDMQKRTSQVSMNSRNSNAVLKYNMICLKHLFPSRLKGNRDATQQNTPEESLTRSGSGLLNFDLTLDPTIPEPVAQSTRLHEMPLTSNISTVPVMEGSQPQSKAQSLWNLVKDSVQNQNQIAEIFLSGQANQADEAWTSLLRALLARAKETRQGQGLVPSFEHFQTTTNAFGQKRVKRFWSPRFDYFFAQRLIALHQPSRVLFSLNMPSQSQTVMSSDEVHRPSVTSLAISSRPSIAGPSMMAAPSRAAASVPTFTVEEGESQLFGWRIGAGLRRWCCSLIGYNRQGHVITYRRTLFNWFIIFCIFATIIAAAIETPEFRLNNYLVTNQLRPLPFYLFDVGLLVIFTFEFLVKVLAQGFVVSPFSYLRSTGWNRLDFLLLIVLYVNVLLDLRDPSGVQRLFRVLRALRPLRIASFFSGIQSIFNTVWGGIPKLLDALLLSNLFLVPLAVYGVRLFNGLLYSCNDNTVTSIDECVGNYEESGLLVPRVWSNPPFYNFDHFGWAWTLVVELSSAENWGQVLRSTMAIRGPGLQPQDRSSPWNVIYFIPLILISSIFVTNLFSGLVVHTFQSRSGMALWTDEQKRWIELKKQLRLLRPSAALVAPLNPFRAFAFELVKTKSNLYAQFITSVLIANMMFFASEFQSNSALVQRYDDLREHVYALFVIIYAVDVVLTLAGLGYTKWASRRWNIFNAITVLGALIMTGLYYGLPNESQTLRYIRVFFLDLLVLRLVSRINSLQNLFRTLVGSLPSIVNVLVVFATVLIIYALMFVEVFGLTRYNLVTDENANSRNFGRAMFLLARISTGETWDLLMHDFTVDGVQCVQSNVYLTSDCGSPFFSYLLFHSFYIIGTFIFLNLFLVVVIDNFTFSYQSESSFAILTRADLRHFRDAWSQLDPKGTGFIRIEDIGKLLRLLRGRLDFRIYQDQWTVPQLKNALMRGEDWKPTERPIERPISALVRRVTTKMRRQGSNADQETGLLIDLQPVRQSTLTPFATNQLQALALSLENLPKQIIRLRRLVYGRLYQELIMSSNQRGQISFNSVLTALSYNLVDTERYLRIEELLKRTIDVDLVQEEIARQRIIEFVHMSSLRRRFLAWRSQQHKKPNRHFVPPKTPQQPRQRTSRPSSNVVNNAPSPHFSSPLPTSHVNSNGMDLLREMIQSAPFQALFGSEMDESEEDRPKKE